MELTQYRWSGAHAGENRMAMEEGDRAEMAGKLLLGKSGNLGQLCVGRTARALKHWLYP